MGCKKGDVLKTAFDSYTVEGQRGAGASGEVYEVRDSDGSSHALKILDPARASAARLKRFRNEIHFCTKDTHRNVIQVQASGVTESGATFYVMPLYSGTLRDLMANGIRPQAVLPYFGQILNGVEAAHLQGVWHRDIKPENILFSAEADLLVVADFGIAHFEEEDLLTAVETKDDDRLANFLYSAPEQKVRGGKVDSKADVYALGLILNEMFSRAVPQGTGFRTVSLATPEYAYLDQLVELMIRQDPGARPSIDGVKRELIARGNEFVSLQRLNSLRSAVIPDTEVDDPLIRNPIRTIGVDYKRGLLRFELSRVPNAEWIRGFIGQGTYQALMGKGPVNFRFEDNFSFIDAQEHEAPTIATHFKNYVTYANQHYAAVVEKEQFLQTERNRRELLERVAEEEKRQRVLKNIRF